MTFKYVDKWMATVFWPKRLWYVAIMASDAIVEPYNWLQRGLTYAYDKLRGRTPVPRRNQALSRALGAVTAIAIWIIPGIVLKST